MYVYVLGVKKTLLFFIVNDSKSQKLTLIAQIYTANSWIVYNFVGCGLDAQFVLGFS